MTIEITNIAEDNVINSAESEVNVTVLGNVADFSESGFVEGNTVTLSLDNMTIVDGMGETITGALDAMGNFSIAVPGSILAGAMTLSLTATVTSAATVSVDDLIPEDPPLIETSDPIAYTVDIDPPLGTVTIVPDDGNFTAGEIIRFTVDFSEGVRFIEQELNDVPDLVLTGGRIANVVGELPADGEFSNQLIFEYTVLPDDNVADLQVIETNFTFVDAAGNYGTITPTNELNIVLDTTDDAGNDLSVSFGDTLINDVEAGVTSVTIAGLDGDATGTLTISSSAGGNPVVVNDVDNGTIENIDVSGLGDGTLTATLSVIDTAGNTSNANNTTTLDTTADVGADLSVSFADSEINQDELDSTVINVAGLDADASGFLTIASTGGGETSTSSFAVNGNGPITVNLSSLIDGSLTATLEVTDTAGNTQIATGNSAVLDQTDPVADLDSNGNLIDSVTRDEVPDQDVVAGETIVLATFPANEISSAVPSTTSDLSYSFGVSGDFDGALSIVKNSGGDFNLVANNSFLDHEVNDGAVVDIIITDGAGNTINDTFTINLNDVNDNPVLPVSDASSININIVEGDDDTPDDSNIAGMATSGTFVFSDDEIEDTHSITVTNISSTAPEGAVVGTFTAGISSQETAVTQGEVEWSFNNLDPEDMDLVDALGVGDTIVQVFGITITDSNNGATTQNFTLTITGTNDAPSISTAAVMAGVQEDMSVVTDDPTTTDVETGLFLTQTGMLDFTDVDLSDNHTASASFTSSTSSAASVGADAQFGELVASVATQTGSDGSSGVVTWDYVVNNDAIQFLAAGETVTEIYTVTVADPEASGGTATQTVTLTITGTNDAPSISTAAVIRTEGDFIDLTDDMDNSVLPPQVPAAALVTINLLTGTVDGNPDGARITDIQDVDLTDIPSIANARIGVDDDDIPRITLSDGLVLSNLAQLTGEQNAPGENANVELSQGVTLQIIADLFTVTPDGDVTYDPNNAIFDSLGDDQSISVVIEYDVVSTSASGEVQDELPQTVTLTINGENDAPFFTSAPESFEATFTEFADGSVEAGSIENTDVHAQSFLITYDDIELTDTHSSTITPVEVNGTPSLADYIGTFSTGFPEVATGLSVGEVIFNFEVEDSVINNLTAGETIIQRYEVVVTDGKGASVSEDIVITIVGTNDAPEITALLVNEVNGETNTIPSLVEDEGGIELGQPSTQTITGSLTFTDADISSLAAGIGDADTHTITGTFSSATLNTGAVVTVPDASDAFGRFEFEIDQNNDTASWTYTAQDQAFDFIANGETLTLTFDITLTDNAGSGVDEVENASDTMPIIITITGTNDAPEISVDAGAGDLDMQTFTESDAGLTVSDTLSLSDADLSDTVMVSSAIDMTMTVLNGTTTDLPSGLADALDGFLSVSSGDVIAAGSDTGTINYTFDSRGVEDAGAFPNAEAFDFLGQGDTLTLVYNVTATDSESEVSNTVPVTIRITGTNDAPVVVADVDAASDNGVAVSGNVIANDSDVDGDPLTVANAGELVGSFGTLTLNTDGSYSYVVTDESISDGFTGTDTFDIDVTDGAATETSVLTINITGENDAPVLTFADTATHIEGVDDNADIDGNITVVDRVPTILDGDATLVDPDSETTSYDSGSLSISINNGLTSDLLNFGSDVVISNSGVVSIDGNDIGMVTGIDTSSLTVDFVEGATSETVQTLIRSITYATESDTPLETRDIDITVTDGDMGVSNTESITVTILASNDSPTPLNDMIEINEGTFGIFNVILGSPLSGDEDTDPDNTTDELSVVQISDVVDIEGDGIRGDATSIVNASPGTIITDFGATVTIQEDGTLQYDLTSPTEFFNQLGDGVIATDTFTYTVSDPDGLETQAIVSVQITGVNDEITAVDDDIFANEGAETGLSGNLVTNDLDADLFSGNVEGAAGDTREIIAVLDGPGVDTITSTASSFIVTLVSGVIITVGLDGNYTVNAEAAPASATVDNPETGSFTYTVQDNDGTQSNAIVNFEITGENDAPFVVADNSDVVVIGDEDKTITGVILADDVDGDSLTFVLSSGGEPVNGSVTINADGTYSYQGNQDFNGSDSFTVEVSDGNGSIDTIVVDVTVDPKNDVPVIGGVNIGNVSEDATDITTSGNLTITDIDEGEGTFEIVPAGTLGDNRHGTFEVLADGSWTYTLDNSDASVQTLEANVVLIDTITVLSDDGSNSQNISVTIIGTADSDIILGDAEDNVINGTNLDNDLSGSDGNDEIIGMDGDDLLIGGLGNDILDGGSGIDTVSYTDIDNNVNVDLRFDDRNTQGAGNDTFISIENLVGSSFDDSLSGDASANEILGGDGNDTLRGQGGNDTLHGGSGDDRLIAGAENDALFGDEGNDVIIGLSGVDILNGGTGNDFLFGGLGNDLVLGGDGEDNLRGNRGNDTIDGGLDADIIRGGGGNDTVFGNSGDDFLFGENGRDTIDGGTGNDVLRGGISGNAGDDFKDIFVFAEGSGFDSIRDFENGLDQLDLTAFHFDSFEEVVSLAEDRPSGLRIEINQDEVIFIDNFALAEFDIDDVIL